MTPLNLDEIESRVNAQAGQPNFEPAYMYKVPHADVTWLIAELRAHREAVRVMLDCLNELSNRKFYPNCAESFRDDAKETLAQARKLLEGAKGGRE